MGESEIDYIGGLDEPYRGLAILQAALSQCLRDGGQKRLAEDLKMSISDLSAEISITEVKAYNKKQAQVNIYGDLQTTKWDKAEQVEILNDNNLKWTSHDCELCRDTGWVANYNTIGSNGKNPCTCDKGIIKKHEKASFLWKTAEERDFQKKQFAQKGNPYGDAQKKQQEAMDKLLQGNTGTTFVGPKPVPTGPPDLPKKGRKFR
jgi:hypothetical protein